MKNFGWIFGTILLISGCGSAVQGPTASSGPTKPAATQVERSEVRWTAQDGTTVYAYEFLDPTTPPTRIALLFHQDNSSSVEYVSLAQWLAKMGYRVFAVDLRRGGTMGNGINRTAEQFPEPPPMLDAYQDMELALKEARKSNEDVAVVGSGYSAALAMKLAVKHPSIKCLIAISPLFEIGGGFNMKEWARKVKGEAVILVDNTQKKEAREFWDGLGQFILISLNTKTSGGFMFDKAHNPVDPGAVWGSAYVYFDRVGSTTKNTGAGNSIKN